MSRWIFTSLLLLATPAGPGLMQAASSASVQLPVEPDVPFVEYRLEIAQVAEADNVQWVRVYPNGRGLAHIPAFKRRGGRYEFRMAPGEVEELARFLLDERVLEIDLSDAAQQRRRIDREITGGRSAPTRPDRATTEGNGVRMVRWIQDAPVTTIIVSLGTAALPAQTGQVEERTLSLYALRQHADWYPEIEAFGRLAAIERRLLELFERPDLRMID